MSLVVRPVAAADIEEAFVWYEQQRRGPGEEFLQEVQRAFGAILESPCQHRVEYRDTRRALLRRFPYSLFYRILGGDVVVVGCFHGSRDPTQWQGRR